MGGGWGRGHRKLSLNLFQVDVWPEGMMCGRGWGTPAVGTEKPHVNKWTLTMSTSVHFY